MFLFNFHDKHNLQTQNELLLFNFIEL